MKRLFAALVLILVASAANAQTAVPAPSQWKNQRGSVMQLFYWSPFSKRLYGTYTNNAPGFPRCAGRGYPLWGESDGKQITFTVVWSAPFLENCNSTTVWAGVIKGKKISTRWVLSYKDAAGNPKTLRGRDFFTLQ